MYEFLQALEEISDQIVSISFKSPSRNALFDLQNRSEFSSIDSWQVRNSNLIDLLY